MNIHYLLSAILLDALISIWLININTPFSRKQLKHFSQWRIHHIFGTLTAFTHIFGQMDMDCSDDEQGKWI
jgi:hypothetical protein